MSQRGRGSGPRNDDPDGGDAELDQRDSEAHRLPSTSRPIVPYDPYRASSSDAARRATRNVAADSSGPGSRTSSRTRRDDPPAENDDPLSAEAWQLELDEVEFDDEATDAGLPGSDHDAPPAPRRPRRQPPAMRGGRGADATSRVRLSPRRVSDERTKSVRERKPRAAVSIGMQRAVAESSLFSDPAALALLALNGVSILVMALLLGARLGAVPSPTVLHLDAAGNPDVWGPARALWRLPLMSFFITVMFLTVSWFLHPIDRFGARFALGAALVVQLVAWVAVIQHVFMV